MKMAIRLLFLAAFWVTCAFGQNAPPVSVLNIYPHYIPHSVLYPRKDDQDFGEAQRKGAVVQDFDFRQFQGHDNFAIEYRNVSNTEIVEVKFKVDFQDRVGPLGNKAGSWGHQKTYTSKQKLAPGATNVAQWPHPPLNNILRMRAEIVKVIFKDRSTWELRN